MHYTANQHELFAPLRALLGGAHVWASGHGSAAIMRPTEQSSEGAVKRLRLR
jgi:hypothetical protein